MNKANVFEAFQFDKSIMFEDFKSDDAPCRTSSFMKSKDVIYSDQLDGGEEEGAESSGESVSEPGED